MKILTELHNVDRAKLLFDLFKNDLENMVNHIQAFTEKIIEEETDIRADWTDTFATADFWIGIAKEVNGICKSKSQSKDLRTKPTTASDQLFFRTYAVISAHALLCYGTKDKKQIQMIVILFS